jgi:hypothetical protein
MKLYRILEVELYEFDPDTWPYYLRATRTNSTYEYSIRVTGGPWTAVRPGAWIRVKPEGLAVLTPTERAAYFTRAELRQTLNAEHHAHYERYHR